MLARRRFVLLFILTIVLIGIWNIPLVRLIFGHPNHCDYFKAVPPFVQSGDLSKLAPISLENAGEITQVAAVGRGLITDIEISPDKEFIAIGSDVGIWLYRTKDASPPLLLEGHAGPVTDVAFSPNSRTLISSGMDCTARLWNTQTGQVFHTLEGHTDSVSQGAFSVDGRLVATGSYDQTARIWDVETGHVLHILQSDVKGVAGGMRGIAFSPDGQWFAYASSSGGGDYEYREAIQFWNLERSEEVDLLPSYSSVGGYRMDLAFSPDSRKLAVLSSELSVFELPSGKVSLDYYPEGVEGNAFPRIRSFQWQANGSAIAVSVRHEDAQDNAQVSVFVVDASTGQDALLIPPRLGGGLVLSFDPEHLIVLYSADQIDYTLERWSLNPEGSATKTTTLKTLAGHTNATTCVAFSQDGRQLAYGGEDTSVRIRDLYSDTPVLALPGHRDEVTQIQYSPDGALIVTGDQAGMIRMWNAHTGVLLWSHPAAAEPVWRTVFNSKSTLLASASGFSGDTGAIQLWDVTTGSAVSLLSQLPTKSIAFSPDGLTLAAATEEDKTVVTLWDIPTRARRSSFSSEIRLILGLAYSPNGKLLAAVTSDNTAQLLDAATGELLAVLGEPGGFNTRSDVVFSPDGSILVAVRDDLVLLWDTDTYREVAILTGHVGRVIQVDFSPDGKLIATGSEDGTARLWGVPMPAQQP